MAVTHQRASSELVTCITWLLMIRAQLSHGHSCTALSPLPMALKVPTAAGHALPNGAVPVRPHEVHDCAAAQHAVVTIVIS